MKQLKSKSKEVPAKREPIKVSDPKDKRLRAYNDSLTAHDVGLYNWNQAKKYGTVTDKGTVYVSDDEVNYIPSKKLKTKLKPESTRYTTSDYHDTGFGGVNKKFPLYKKPVQPYKLEKNKTITKAPVKAQKKPVAKAEVKPVAKPTQKSTPIVKEEKKMYQGRKFMDSTGLRPALYTKSQVSEAVAKKKKSK
jgi:hypothetical protein